MARSHRFTSSPRGRRLVPPAALTLTAALLAAGCGGSSGDSNKDTTAPANSSGGATAPASKATSLAKIDSAVTSGTGAAPSVTVKGSGFGPRPAPKPPYPPAGKQGCPAAPPAGAGHLFGTKLYFTDAKAKRGSYKNWTAGQYTKEFFDCVGLVIDGWTDTQVRFHFGNIYGKVIPQNTYLLSDGDVFKVFVNGATLAGKATLGK